MKIDSSVEAKVRAALHGAVKGNAEQFEHAMRRLHTGDDAREGLRLVVAIAGVLLGSLTPEETAELADNVAADESWSAIPVGEFRSGVAAMLAGDPPPPVVPYVVAAYLLATAAEPRGRWYDVLDEVETELEDQPG